MIAAWSRELWGRNRLLSLVAAGHLLLFLVLVPASLIDPTTVLGISRWIKPMKFAISIAIFTATMAWLLGYLRESRRAIRIIALIIAISMTGEIVLIAMQSARGVPSHFNADAPIDAAVFTAMGLLIALNTLAVMWALLLFFIRPVAVTPALRTGIRLGLLIFVLASLEGVIMILRNGHGVGVADGSPGLPFVNWSTAGGDLRIAHFFGMHALQLMPLLGWFLDRRGVPRAPRWVVITAAAYALIIGLLLVQALAGQPLLAMTR